METKWELVQTPDDGIHILRDGKNIGHIYRTFHPRLPYEVFWNDKKETQRCYTPQEGLDIVKAAIAKIEV